MRWNGFMSTLCMQNVMTFLTWFFFMAPALLAVVFSFWVLVHEQFLFAENTIIHTINCNIYMKLLARWLSLPSLHWISSLFSFFIL